MNEAVEFTGMIVLLMAGWLAVLGMAALSYIIARTTVAYAKARRRAERYRKARRMGR